MNLKVEIEQERKKTQYFIERLNSLRLQTDITSDIFPSDDFKKLKDYLAYREQSFTKLLNILLEYASTLDDVLNQKSEISLNNESIELIEDLILKCMMCVINESKYVDDEQHIYDLLNEEGVRMVEFLNAITYES